tara:strand:+ start:495 stop:701 length:207 start_codon:yes stop_codon:yes gene_type:complete
LSKIRKPISVEDADQVKNLCENLIAVIANVQDKNKSLTPIARESIDDILDLIIDIKVDCVDYINREGQ